VDEALESGGAAAGGAGEAAVQTPALIEQAHHVMHYLAFGVGVIGVIVLLWGVMLGVGGLIRAEAMRFRGEKNYGRQARVRQTLGYYLLLGIEFLVAADVIETIKDPDLDTLLVLGLTVVIRTVISLSLGWELKHDIEHGVEGGSGPIGEREREDGGKGGGSDSKTSGGAGKKR
jgi:uncharacterized membrane protein